MGLTTVIFLLIGLLLIVFGANYLTDGSSAIAKRLHVSEFIIGLTIVGVGTSMPELVVSVISALAGHSEIAIGNVVGSNIFNTFVILGICAVVIPVQLTQRNIYRDIPMGILASLILLLVTYTGTIHRTYGVLMILIYIATMIYSVKSSRPSKEEIEAEKLSASEPIMPTWLSIVAVVGGLAGLIFGGQLFINNAVIIAEYFNIPENVIAITLVAGGTSMPELAASLVSLIKGKSDIALGNVIGSNISNILLILGVSSTISPLSMGSITMVDILAVVVTAAFLFLAAFTFKKREIDRAEGVIMLVAFGFYMWHLIG